MVGDVDSSITRTQALESGAVGYLEKPLDLRLLKEELRRLLQQTGFSADLDSFDLLDVIQVITMNRNNIALLVNTGVEERGMLRFQNGELIWAEYGTLRGEEAFFALAAHKNGSVVQQQWNEPIVPNVKQPLSRLILQALQYRTKYANMEQYVADAEPDTFVSLAMEEDDDTPFVVQAESSPSQRQDSSVYMATNQEAAPVNSNQSKEWWERTGSFPTMQESMGHIFAIPSNGKANGSPTFAVNGYMPTDGTDVMMPSTGHKAVGERSDLPSWLTDQPTASDMPVVRPSSLSDSARIPVTPVFKSSSPEWQIPVSAIKVTDDIGSLPIPTQLPPSSHGFVADIGIRPTSSPEWQLPEQVGFQSQLTGGLQSLSPARRTQDIQENSPTLGMHSLPKQGYNYPALVSALQTLGYSIRGFVAAAVVTIDGQPIAQVAVDDLDIAQMCKQFSIVLQGVLQVLDQGLGSTYEDMRITCNDRCILMRIVGSERRAFQLLITTYDADSSECLEIMANVEGAISAALH
jgi:predicted regulator of Ras-like GTPase activity (Roadblock/LC7/MglB family)